MVTGPPGVLDSARGWPQRLPDVAFCLENRAFLTRPCRVATYSNRMTLSYEVLRGLLRVGLCIRVRGTEISRLNGSSLRQRILRVAAKVHNNKEMGP